MNNIKQIPMLFSTLMLQAILDGRKTITRRILKHGFVTDTIYHPSIKVTMTDFDEMAHFKREDGIPRESFAGYKSPYGKIGDAIWVREAHYSYGWWVKNGVTKAGKQKWRFIDFTSEDQNGRYHFIDNPPQTIESERTEKTMGWYKRSSLFMPKEAARIWLKVKSIRVERLCDITPEDAIAEGIEPMGDGYRVYTTKDSWTDNPIGSFSSLWEKINGIESCRLNPWVWVVEFEVLSTTGKPEHLN